MAKRKIAILGGGMGALGAAWQLSAPSLRGRFEITVYQLGWRLGGKGASGRDLRPGYGDRILEHGLHVWAGFYEQAFRIMRDCYREAGRPAGSPLSCWYDPKDQRASAFWPARNVTVEERVGGRWKHWSVELPANDELPGDSATEPAAAWEILHGAMELLAELFEGSPIAPPSGLENGVGLDNLVVRAIHRRPRTALFRSERARRLGRALKASLGPANAAPAEGLLHRIGHALAEAIVQDAAAATLERILATLATGRPAEHAGKGALHGLLVDLHEAIAKRVRRDLDADDALRRLWLICDLVLAHARGLVADGAILHGLDVLNDRDWAAWLAEHGASPLTLESPLVRGIYDYVFGYLDGDTSRRALEAGTAVHGLWRLAFGYRGAVFWEMQAGMGDTVFAPLYQVLCRRGVRFRFFQRVKSLALDAERRAVEAVAIGVQATEKSAYQPLVDVGGVPSWPDRPRYAQLVQGQELERRGIDLESAYSDWPDVRELELVRGRDFDDVVLGISIGALPAICAELCAADPRWQRMIDAVKVVQTQAMQLWLTPDRAGLGWDGPAPLVTAYAEPFATWGDLSHLRAAERWPAGEVGSIAYFCGPLPTMKPGGDPAGFPARAAKAARANATAWLDRNTRHLWPRAHNGDGLDWQALVDPEGRVGAARLDAQYFRANVEPSEQYVLSVPGTSAHRLAAGDTGFSNLAIAGDWVKTRINAGCIEAAALAGIDAAEWLCRAVRDGNLPPDELPEYVERGGQTCFRQPLELFGCDLRAFVLDADLEALRRLCDAQLNGPARGGRRYLPLVPRVLLAFAAMDRATSADPRDRAFGWMSEIDVAFWVPVAVLAPEGARYRVVDVAWYLPYVFVDNPWAVTTGREIYGFHKQLGVFSIPSRDGDGAYAASALVLPEHGAEARAEVRTILTVERPLGSGDERETLHRWLDDAASGLRQAIFGAEALIEVADHLDVDGAALAVNLADHLDAGRVPMVFLKQFRDAKVATRACYQRVVHATARVHPGSLRGAGLLAGEYRLSLANFASHPIAADLGLPAGQSAVRACLWTEFSFEMEAAE